jgi:predicted Zn finger-like uncharacterized protein
MQFICESCKANLQIADEKVRGKRLIVRCKRCGVQIRIADPALSPGSPSRAAADPSSSASKPPPGPDRDSPAGSPKVATSSPAGPIRNAPAPKPTDTESTRAMDSEVLERALRASKEEEGTQRAAPPRTVPPPPPPRETPARNQPIWFAMIQGQQIGPITAADLGRKAKAGEIAPRTYLWKEGMASWMRAKDIQEVVSAFAAPPAPPPAPPRSTPTENKLDLPFEASDQSKGAALPAPPQTGAGEAFLLSPETRTPPGGVSASAEGSIPPLAADGGADADGLVISTDPDDSPPAALDLARWGAEELSKPRAETPIPASKRAAQSVTAAATPAFALGQSEKRAPLRFIVLGIAAATVAALVVFAVFYGRNEAKHSSLERREVPKPAAATPVSPAAPPETPAKTAEHKPAEPPAPEPTAAGPAVPPDVLKKKVDENMPALQGCVDQALQRDPALRVGRLLILTTVAPNGTVTSTRIDKRTVDQSALGACLKAATQNIRFPSFNGAAMPVDIPIVVAEGR